jgi:hypothetical protein
MAISIKTGPYTQAEAVTPHDSNAQGSLASKKADAVFVGSSANVALVVNGTAVTFTGVPAGTILPIAASRVNATNTTATGIVALWM